jgi:hypothetical protein
MIEAHGNTCRIWVRMSEKNGMTARIFYRYVTCPARRTSCSEFPPIPELDDIRSSGMLPSVEQWEKVARTPGEHMHDRSISRFVNGEMMF